MSGCTLTIGDVEIPVSGLVVTEKKENQSKYTRLVKMPTSVSITYESNGELFTDVRRIAHWSQRRAESIARHANLPPRRRRVKHSL